MPHQLQSYEDLVVWQKAVLAAQQTYVVTRNLPIEERYGLASQMQRAAVSIASNIAEGYARGTTKDYLQFLRISLGSTCELKTQVTIAKATHPTIQYNELENVLTEVSKMLTTMIKRLTTKP